MNYPIDKPKKGFDRVLDVIGTMVGILIALAIIIAICSFTSKIDCGEQIGSYNTIPVYYNDGYHSCDDRHWSSDGDYMYGMKSVSYSHLTLPTITTV